MKGKSCPAQRSISILALTLMIGWFVGISPSSEAAAPPNLVFIIADDCTYLDMEVYGGQAKTPHLNRFAAEGMTFSRCFQAAPMCSPTRHNIYTGLYPVRSGAWPNHTCVYPGTRSVAHYLKDAGYRVALSGKKHIAPRESFPFEYSDTFRTAEPTLTGAYPDIDRLLGEAKRQNQPFCLFACSNEPHSPYTRGDATAYPPATLQLPPSWVDTAETRAAYSAYLAEITFFDQQCGALLKLIDDHGLTGNTLVIITSEQGSGFPFAKWTCFELGLASGMIARWPGKIAAGSQTDALVEYVDITPTFLDIVHKHMPDVKIRPESDDLDGRSFLPVLLGTTNEHKRYTFGIHTTRGIINGSDAFGIRSCGTTTHRYIRNLHSDVQFTNVVTRKGGDKADFWTSWIDRADQGDPHARLMTRKYAFRPAEELYDVANDPHCLKNLISDPMLAVLREELSVQLDHWMKRQGDKGAPTEAIAHTRKAGYKAPPVSK